MYHKTTHRCLWIISLLLSVACYEPLSDGSSGDETNLSVQPEPAREASHSIVTSANVYDHEADWPAIVAMTESWLPSGSTAELKEGYRGALVRVNGDGDPRIDFGRHGKHDVPVEKTDLVPQANAVREGRQYKAFPNFIRQVGTRLVVSNDDELRALASSEVASSHFFLCLFADPFSSGFPDLVEGLEELHRESGIQTILFPQAVDRSDMEALMNRLAAIPLRVPFSYPHLTADYTDSILGLNSAVPSILLLTDEGRVLYRAEGVDDLDPAEIQRMVGG